MKRYVAVFVLLALLPAPAVHAEDPLALAITVKDVDLANCKTWHDGKSKAADKGYLLRALGVVRVTSKTDNWHRRWSAGRAGIGPSRNGRHSTKPETFHYQIAFVRPVAVGSVLCTNRELRVLKPDAPYPGDPAKPEHWQRVKIPPLQQRIRLAALPVGVKTRAILLTDLRRSGHSYAAPVRVYKRRLHNIATVAGVAAKSQYIAPRAFGYRSYAAANVVRGRGSWHSNGKSDTGRIYGPVISDIAPSWYALAWDTPQELVGVFSMDNFRTIKTYRFAGASTANPLVGAKDDWDKIHGKLLARQHVHVRSDHGRWLAFAEPIRTTGLKIEILRAWERKKNDSQVARLDALAVFVDLKDKPVPRVTADGRPEPPVSVPYTLAADGFFTMAIDGPDGRRVRNLAARVERDAGDNAEGWNLKDDAGQFVKPGTYKWKAITHPGLQVKYEQTPYPNVAQHHPENTPWLNARTGSGGWLADHSPPFGGCSGGDYNFFCAPVPESGIGFAACDLSGKKLWGITSFGAWTGGNRLASDGRKVYVEAFGWHDSDAGADRVWEVDIATQKVKEIFRAKSNERRVRGCKGIATRDGKVYLAINARAKWIANAAGVDAVDINRCVPFYKEKRKPRKPYEIVPDPRGDFLRLLRLTGRPPGYAKGHGLTYLESTRGPGSRQEIIVAFQKAVNIGSCLYPVPPGKDIKVQLFALKPEAPYPPNPRQRDHWVPFESNAKLAWDVATPPEGTATRALMISFAKGDVDELTEIMEDGDDLDAELDLGGGGGGSRNRNAWQAKLEGFQILRRRFRNLFGNAKVRVSSGAVAANGTWAAQRDEPLSPAKPAVYLMEWTTAQSIRGLAIKEIDCKLAEVDIWTGNGTPTLQGSAGWENVGKYVPRRRMQHSGFAGHNALARYMDGAVDFGRDIKTRAVRLRMVAQWTTNTREGSCAKDQLGLDPKRCRVFGVAPLQYIGGEVPVDPLMTERLEVLDPQSGTIEEEIAIPKPGDLDFGPDGTLYALSGKRLVAVDRADGKHKVVATDLLRPLSIAVDGDGLIYVFDAAAKRQTIRVYDATGKLVRRIGKPGGYRVGPWDPQRLENLTAMSVDKEGKLWVVSKSYWPKRVACFKTDGTHLRDYLGPTEYGSGGVLDPGDKRRLFYGPMEFELDWEKRTSRLKNLTWDPAQGREAGEMPVYVNSRKYMVNRPRGSHNTMNAGIVYIYEKDRLRRVAAVGYADAFSGLRRQDIIDKLDGKLLTRLQFIWTDRNGDGDVQFAEVRFNKRHGSRLTRFDHRLEIQAGGLRYRIKEFLPNGAPVYDAVTTGLPGGESYRLDNGNYYYLGQGASSPDRVLSPGGKALWTYPNEGAGVHPFRTCKGYTSDQVVCQFAMVGHETAKQGDLGEFFVYNANWGSWYVWTVDGLLAGRIFRDLRDPGRVPWTMKEHQRGLDLTEVTAGQEHFNGWFCRTPDGKYYVVAGHHQSNVAEVVGINDFKRLNGTITVTPADILKAQEYEKRLARHRQKDALRLIKCQPIAGRIQPDGHLGDWKTGPVAGMGDGISLRLGYDRLNLYAAFEINNRGPLKNSGRQWDKLFKTGAAVDLMFGLDPAADAKRKAPVKGDKRLLMTVMNGKPIAVLYDAVVPGTPADDVWQVVSPVTRVDFDVVRKLTDVELAVQPTDRGYIVEALIPLQSIGLTISPDTPIRLDWGFLETDKDGTVVLSRTYWSNKATSALADAPSEARLEPDLWGYCRFLSKRKGLESKINPGNLLEEKADDIDLDDLELD